MRKYAPLCIFFFSMMVLSESGFCQLTDGALKKKNRKVSRFSGHRIRFKRENKYNSLIFSVNALNYYGDLAPRPNKISTDISFTRPALGFAFSHRLAPRFSWTGSFMYGTLRGSDAESADRGDFQSGIYRSNRNLSFRNRIKELSLVGTVDLFPNRSNYFGRVRWTPYLFAGVAVFHHNPQATAPATDLRGNALPEAGQWVDLRPLGTEGQNSTLKETDVNYGIKSYSLIQFSVPFGVGMRLRLTEFIDFSAELGFRYLFTDYIDDVSQNYVDLGVLQGELARAMSYRSNENPAISPNQLLATTVRDGSSYNILPGYGVEFKSNNRGNKGDLDTFMVTSLKLSYIIGTSSRRAIMRLRSR